MSEEHLRSQILEVWNEHVSTVKTEKDAEGQSGNNIDDSRVYAIEVVKIIIHNFMKGDFDVNDFRTALDSYNKHNNLWGFTAKLGQMYFNQMIKYNENSLDKLGAALKELITEPKNLRDALTKIETLEKMTIAIYTKAKDKHNAPYPGAVGFFLTYFWQINNYKKWPILYPNLISSFKELDIWEEQKTQKATYEVYLSVYNKVKGIIEEIAGREVSYWEVEHALWNFKFKPEALSYVAELIPSPKAEPSNAIEQEAIKEELIVQPAFVETAEETRVEERSQAQDDHIMASKEAINYKEYLMPRLSRLLNNGYVQDDAENSFSALVLEAFSQLDFQVEVLDQNKEKNAYAVLRFREENIAIILDAHPSSGDFQKENDRRIVKEYISDNLKALNKEGYKKVTYILVSNHFTDLYNSFVSYINWNTDIKKTILISTEAILYILAYKLKKKQGIYPILDRFGSFSSHIHMGNVSEELERI
jgi:hypothetical protein